MATENNPEFKYIAVYNWGNFQERLRKGTVKRPKVMESVHKDSDPDYSQLTCLQRYVLDGCRRLIGLHGRNLNNDVTWVARALCVIPTERAHVSHAIHKLTTRGLLLLTNQRDPFSKELNGTEGKGTEPIPPEAEESEQDTEQSLTDLMESEG